MKNPLGADGSQSGFRFGFALAAFIKRPQAEAQIGAIAIVQEATTGVKTAVMNCREYVIWPAFLGIAIISAMSLFFQAGLPRDAGAEVSGNEVQEELKAEGLIK